LKLPIQQNPPHFPVLRFRFTNSYIYHRINFRPIYWSWIEPFACLDAAHVCRFTHSAAPNCQALDGHCLWSHYFKDVLGVGQAVLMDRPASCTKIIPQLILLGGEEEEGTVP